MGGPKTLTIGVTVNLEHYENLRLEVSGEVDSPEDAEEISRFLDTILVRFGRSDPATAERIDSYRRRVLPGSQRRVRPRIFRARGITRFPMPGYHSTNFLLFKRFVRICQDLHEPSEIGGLHQGSEWQPGLQGHGT